jgi:PAS domain S-box-containing protein
LKSSDRIDKEDGELNREPVAFKRVEEIVEQRLEELYRSFMQNFKGIAYRAEMDSTPVFFHGAVGEITGYSEDDFITGGLRWDQLIHPEDLANVFSKEEKKLRLTPYFIYEREYRILRKDAKVRWVQEIIQNICDEFGQPKMLQGVLYDITDRKQAEEEKKKLEIQLQQAQKMEAIGTLAGGIAHDFNNILSAVIGYSELARKEVPEESKLYRYINGIREAGKRARGLVAQILAFSRKSEDEKKSIQITPLLKECLKLLRASLPTTIEIRQNIGTQLGNVMADPTQMHQVIMNLCTNAAHAMQGEGGSIEVSLESVNLDMYFTSQHPDMKKGEYLNLMIRDSGCGMTVDVMGRIFEPYFTTKEKGVGTGLGLAVTHGIITSHGGTITVESNPGTGSTFTIFLPVISEPSAHMTSTSAFLPMGTECILYIDDEEDLVDIAKEMLGSLSYKVVGTTSSIEALKLFQANPEKFDLIITDMAMPKMTGVELAKEFMRIRPDIPIILCTGFSEAITEEEAKALGIRKFILKPILKDKLALAISRVLYENRHRKKKAKP